MAKRKAGGDQIEAIEDQVIAGDEELVEVLQTPTPWKKVDSYVTSSGVELKFNPLRDDYLDQVQRNLRVKLIREGEPLDPPMHEEIGFGGRKIQEPYDQAAIDELPEDDPIREQWILHKAAEARFFTKAGQLRNRITILKGIANEVPQEWIEEQKALGNPLPEDPYELKQQWLEFEAIWNEDDFVYAFMLPRALAHDGLTEEGFQLMLASFRDLVGAATGRKQNTANGSKATPEE